MTFAYIYTFSLTSLYQQELDSKNCQDQHCLLFSISPEASSTSFPMSLHSAQSIFWVCPSKLHQYSYPRFKLTSPPVPTHPEKILQLCKFLGEGFRVFSRVCPDLDMSVFELAPRIMNIQTHHHHLTHLLIATNFLPLTMCQIFYVHSLTYFTPQHCPHFTDDKIKVLTDWHRLRGQEQRGRDLNSSVFDRKVQTSRNSNALP